MLERYWAFSEDLPRGAVVATTVVLGLCLLALVLELLRSEKHAVWIAASGLMSLILLGAAVLRPVEIRARGGKMGPKVVVLLDQSRRLLIHDGEPTRRERQNAALAEVERHYRGARVSVLGFSEGPPKMLSPAEARSQKPSSLYGESDLLSALESLARSQVERPRAIVVLSDGRLSRPGTELDDATLKQALGNQDVPIHSVRLTEKAPPDATIRSVKAARAAVAHQAFGLTIEVGCSGGFKCENIPVTVRELRSGVEPAVLAHGVANAEKGTGAVELEIVLDRAGARIVEISIEAPEGDQVPENNSRVLTFSVTRDRLRLLHVAGRPTYDVRALRMWLKSDEFIDLVAFFILRTLQDDTNTTDESELALIPFPVEELFTSHLPSFDAVIIQDIDAVNYKLDRYLPSLAAYVNAGGGLIMVGGPSAFAGGRYAGTAIESVLPVELPTNTLPFDPSDFVPRYTRAGSAAPVLRGLAELAGEQLPEMPGANMLGPARQNAIVLWEHSRLMTSQGRPMPVLALGESGDGRAIALGVDGTHQLAFSELAVASAGRAYGALWEGLLGWLMRDPRFESARMEIVGECIAGEPLTLRIWPLPGMDRKADIEFHLLGAKPKEPIRRSLTAPETGPLEVTAEGFEAGGYTARVKFGEAPPTRFDFACERGGEAMRDSRPDPERLERISALTGGKSVAFDDVDALPPAPATEVQIERRATPILPAWAWSLAAAAAVGVHWVVRRRGGLA